LDGFVCAGIFDPLLADHPVPFRAQLINLAHAHWRALAIVGLPYAERRLSNRPAIGKQQ
jgi:hypothetical protein